MTHLFYPPLFAPLIPPSTPGAVDLFPSIPTSSSSYSQFRECVHDPLLRECGSRARNLMDHSMAFLITRCRDKSHFRYDRSMHYSQTESLIVITHITGWISAAPVLRLSSSRRQMLRGSQRGIRASGRIDHSKTSQRAVMIIRRPQRMKAGHPLATPVTFIAPHFIMSLHSCSLQNITCNTNARLSCSFINIHLIHIAMVKGFMTRQST